MKTITYYIKYGRLGASSRMRTLQFIPFLNQVYSIKICELLSDEYVFKLYNKKPQNKFRILKAYIKRYISVVKDKSDIIIIEKELFPYFPYWVEKICLKNKKYIIDIDDAVFLNYERHRLFIVRKLFSQKFAGLFARAATVFAGSPYLVEVAKKYNKNTLYIPTVVNLKRYLILPVHSISLTKKPIVIGWIGTLPSLQHLYLLKAVFLKLADKFDFELHIIGVNFSLANANLKIKNLPWHEDTEVNLLNAIDIGIMPLADTDFTRGKCAYKLIQYMACGKPVVASAVGANMAVVEHGVNGYLCQTDSEWFDYLSKLILEPKLRQEFGIKGRQKVEAQYSTEVITIKIKQAIERILCVE